jgi:hypothetical protein
MQRTTSNVGCIVVLVMLMSGAALGEGADLATDPNGYDNWKDRVTFIGPMPGFWEYLAVDVEYCVYEPGQFDLSFPDQDPSEGLEWVYAYQAFNNLDPHPSGTPDYIKRISIDLDGNESAKGCYYLSGTGIEPDEVDDLSVAAQAGWRWDVDPAYSFPYSVDPAAISAVLIFTSPYGPEMDNATVSGKWPAGGEGGPQLPSPVPEPATTAILLAGMGLWLRKRR